MQSQRQRLTFATIAAGFLLLFIWSIQPTSVRADGPPSVNQVRGTYGTVPPPTAPTATPIATAPTATPIATTPPTYARITVIKEAQPKSMQDFTFFGPTGKFLVDDDAGVEGGSDELATSYSVSVPAGHYNISEAMNPSWYLAQATCTIDGTELNQRTLSLSVAAGAEVTCTFINQRRVEITANVFLDSNSNGAMEAGEPGVAGFEVRLYDNQDRLSHRFVSDASGQVLFTRLIPGDYQACLLLHSADGSDNSKTDLTINNPDLRCQPVSLQPGESAQVDFGLSLEEAGTPAPTNTPIPTAPATPTAIPTAPPTATPVPTAPASISPLHVSNVTMQVHYSKQPDINEAAQFPMYIPFVVR